MATVGKTPYKGLSIPNHYDPSMEEYRKNMISIDLCLHQVLPDQNSTIHNPDTTVDGIYMLYGDSALDNDIGFLEVYSHIVGGTLFTSQCFRSLTKPELVLYRTCTGGESWSSWVKYANILNGGEGSGFDSDKIDGKHLSSLFTTDKTETDFNNAVLSGQYHMSDGCTNSPSNNNEDWICVVYNIEGTIYQLAFQTSGSLIYYEGNTKPIYYPDGVPVIYVRMSNSTSTWTAWQVVWHSGIDGKGYGLDADTLDGLHGSSYVEKNNLLSEIQNIGGSGSGIDADTLDGFNSNSFASYGKSTNNLITTQFPESDDGSSAMYRFYDSGNIIGEGSNVYYGIIQIYSTSSYYMRIAVSMSSGKVYRQTSGAVAWNEITPVIPVVSSDPTNPSEGQMWILNS